MLGIAAKVGVAILVLGVSSVAFSQIEPVESQGSQQVVPAGLVNLQASGAGDDDSSEVLGIEGLWNFSRSSGFAWGALLSYQSQKFEFESGTRFNETRLGLGISANQYFALSENIRGWAGVKYLYFTGMGQTEEALDCLYCSNVKEDYNGSNAFGSFGIISGRTNISLDFRLTDKASSFVETANDPFGVGPSYRREADGIPDPQWVLNVGYAF